MQFSLKPEILLQVHICLHWQQHWNVEAYFYLLGDLFLSVCTGNPRSRETGVSCADWQRPAAVPLPAWEQGGPKEPLQESSAHHHQVQYNSTLRSYSV